MSINNTNPVGLSYIDQQEKDVNRKEKYFFNKEQEKFIYYYPSFGKNKCDEVIIELASTINFCKENNLNYLKNDADVLQYTHFLIIKHFSSLHDELNDKAFEVHVETLSKLYDTGMYDIFFNEIFDEDEVQKLIDQLISIEDLANKYVKEIQYQKDNISKNVNNQLLKEKILN